MNTLKKELFKYNITVSDFSLYILNCNRTVLSGLMRRSKHLNPCSTLQQGRLQAIQKWLNDENKIPNFNEARENMMQTGRANAKFIYLKQENSNRPTESKEGSSEPIFPALTHFQRIQLGKAFKVNSEPDNDALEYLSDKLELSFGAIIQWFDERKERKN